MSNELPAVICLVGPTGAGKTAAALHLAERFAGTVINADSRQVYRDFPIITAQPTAEEQAQCPHRLYGFLETEARMSAGVWGDHATAAIDEALAQGRLPLLVGGTGMYVRALLDGIAAIPAIPRDIHVRWQERCAAEGPQRLHAMLCDIDAEYAARIHPNDRQRVTRALEVHEHTGRTFSEWHRSAMPAPRYRALRIGFAATLDALTPRLAHRIDLMLAAGALDEARRARVHCDDPSAPGWSGIGCAETYAHLVGSLDYEAMRHVWLHNTRAYAKRQLTWFRADTRLTWYAPDDVEGIALGVASFLRGDA